MKTKNIVLLSVVILIGLIAASYTYRYYTAELRGKVSAKERIESANHRLYSYEYFYDLKASIDAYDAALDAQKEVLKSAETTSERSRIRSNIAGIKAQKQRAIEKYNNDAKKVKTRGKFRSDDLPYQINN